jgi:hypothetical protein
VDGLEQGIYHVTVEKDGYAQIDLGSITVDKDINLGDIAMKSTGGRS